MQGKARKGTGARTSKTPAGGGEFSAKLGFFCCALCPGAALALRKKGEKGSPKSPPGPAEAWDGLGTAQACSHGLEGPSGRRPLVLISGAGE